MASSSSRSTAAASSAARPATVQAGWWYSWRASIPIASGRQPHSRVISATPGSAELSPGRTASRTSSPAASPGGRASRLIVCGVFQRGQPPPAGDQHQAAAAAGQQRADLLAARRVVQDQQQLPSGQPVAPQPGPRLQVRRDLPCRDADGQQQAGQRIGRVHRLAPGGVRVQRQEDLPGREPAGQPVRGMHGKRGLADAGHPADRVDAHHPARPRRRVGQFGELVLPPGERGDVAGQRPGRRRHPPAAGPARHRMAPRGSLELNTGRAAQLQRVGEQPHRVLVRGGGQAPLQVADRPRVQPRRLSQLLLGQRGLRTQLPQHTGEPKRRLSHGLSSCPGTRNPRPA